MLDVGWQELFLIAVVTIIVVGPKEIPRVLRTVTMSVRKIKGMARDFQNSIDDLARETELDDIKKELEKSKDFDLERDIEDAIDPTGEFSTSINEIGEAASAPDSLPGSRPGSIVKPEEPEENKMLPADAPKKPAENQG